MRDRKSCFAFPIKPNIETSIIFFWLSPTFIRLLDCLNVGLVSGKNLTLLMLIEKVDARISVQLSDIITIYEQLYLVQANNKINQWSALFVGESNGHQSIPFTERATDRESVCMSWLCDEIMFSSLRMEQSRSSLNINVSINRTHIPIDIKSQFCKGFKCMGVGKCGFKYTFPIRLVHGFYPTDGLAAWVLPNSGWCLNFR